MRHALVTVHLIHEARAAADAEAAERQTADAPAEPQAVPEPRRFAALARRFAALARRARARTRGLRAESPGGGA